jgi:hypothetical protein
VRGADLLVLGDVVEVPALGWSPPASCPVVVVPDVPSAETGGGNPFIPAQ